LEEKLLKENINSEGNMRSRIRVALVYYSSFSSFIENDFNILSKHFDVRQVNLRSARDLPGLASAIYWCDLSFTWFAGEHAVPTVVLSRALGKKSVVVAGGYDVACQPEINYGQFTLPWHKRFMNKFVLNHADAILPVSDFTRRETLRWSRPKRLELVYNGVDVGRLGRDAVSKKEDLVLTVGGLKKDTIRRKGIEAFVKSAALVPEAHFAVIGEALDDSIDHLISIASENVEFTGRISDSELAGWYRRAKVYVQASAYESFGMALAEAMLCGCVPVVTERGAIPEVAGDAGFYVPYGDVEKVAEGIRIALKSDLGSGASERIRANFSKERRDSALTRIIEELCDESFTLS
jgi:glycosyltransferase involved in cell wall biosynthesis